jgi:hypothetical protein
MQNQIKDIIGQSSKLSWQPVGVDEEQQLISFRPEDLSAVINAVLHVAADLCENYYDSERILNYAKGIK